MISLFLGKRIKIIKKKIKDIYIYLGYKNKKAFLLILLKKDQKINPFTKLLKPTKSITFIV
jgi:hypothetical protein